MKIRTRTVIKSPRRIEVEVMEGDAKDTLYFESNEALWEVPPVTDDFAAVALCQYCSAKKTDLFIEGTLSESTLLNLDEFIKIWSTWRPDLFTQIKIEAKKTVQDTPGRDKPAVAAFSGGVDSCFALAAHQSKLAGDSSREIALGVLIVGFDLQKENQDLIHLAYENAKRALDFFGARCAIIETNWRERFCPDWLMGFVAGVACVLQTLSGRYSSGVFSSDLNYLEEFHLGPYGSHMTTNHLLGSYTFPIVSTGMYTRLERVGFLCSRFPDVVDHLRVCWQSIDKGTNCGVCEKCVRTRLEMMIYNKEPDIFNAPMSAELIESLALSYITIVYFEEIYKRFAKDHPLYETIERVYLREKRKLNREEGLLSALHEKDGEISLLNNEIQNIRRSKSYRITKPLRFLRGLLK